MPKRCDEELPHLEVALEIGQEVIVVPHGLLQDVVEIGLRDAESLNQNPLLCF